MFKRGLSNVGLLLLLLLLNSCSRYLTDFMPTAEFRGIKVASANLQPQIVPQGPEKVILKGKIILDLKCLFRNPYKTNLLIPAHKASFFLRNTIIPLYSISKDTFTIPEHGQSLQHYKVELNLEDSKLRECLGKDNHYEFRCEMKIDVKDYVKGKGSILVNNPVVDALGGSKFDLKFSFVDTLRIPKPPIITPNMTSVPKMQLTGKMDTLDLSDLQNFKKAMMSFADTVLFKEIRIVDPNNPINTKEESQGGYDVGVFHVPKFTFQVVDGNNPLNYKSVKVIDLIKQIDASAPGAYTNFLSAWNLFKSFNPPVIQYPGEGIKGIKVIIPVTIHNPNEFSIECPSFNAAAFSGSYNPFIIMLSFFVSSCTISPGSDISVNLEGYLNWDNNFLTFFQAGSQNLEPKIRGAVQFDLGYGLIDVPFPE